MKTIALLLFPLVLSGCLLSTAPFYTEDSIITDGQFVGTYEKDGTWIVSTAPNNPKHYRIMLRERNEWIELEGTLFTIDEKIYLDLKKEKENPSTAEDLAGSSQVQFLSKILSDSTHAVLGISIDEDGITLFGSDIFAIRNFRDSFKPKRGRMIVYDERLTLTTGTEESRDIISEAHKQSGLFQKPIFLKRKLEQ
tara:strand:- start:364 stop:948 length:585 start_codon:yes stop_codon:yes gene_type:complete